MAYLPWEISQWYSRGGSGWCKVPRILCMEIDPFYIDLVIAIVIPPFKTFLHFIIINICMIHFIHKETFTIHLFCYQRPPSRRSSISSLNIPPFPEPEKTDDKSKKKEKTPKRKARLKTKRKGSKKRRRSRSSVRSSASEYSDSERTGTPRSELSQVSFDLPASDLDEPEQGKEVVQWQSTSFPHSTVVTNFFWSTVSYLWRCIGKIGICKPTCISDIFMSLPLNGWDI